MKYEKKEVKKSPPAFAAALGPAEKDGGLAESLYRGNAF